MERRTRQRAALKEAIEQAARPLTPQEILAEAQDAVPGLGIATVYRNIKALMSEGWLHKVEMPGGVDRYERAGLHHHHHFHCQECDRVFDVEGCPGNVESLAPPGFQVASHEIVLYGRCATCSS